VQSPKKEFRPAGAPGLLPSHRAAQLQVGRSAVSSNKGFLAALTGGGSLPADGCRLSSREAVVQAGCDQTAKHLALGPLQPLWL